MEVSRILEIVMQRMCIISAGIDNLTYCTPYHLINNTTPEQNLQIKDLSRQTALAEITISAIIILLNTIVVAIYCRLGERKLKAPNTLLANQAVVDLVIAISLVMSTLQLYLIITDKIYILIIHCIYHYFTFLKLLALLLTSGERYCALSFPLFHRKVVTRELTTCIIIATWFLALAHPLILLPFHFSSLEIPSYIPVIMMAILLFLVFLVLFTLGSTYMRSKDAIAERIKRKKSTFTMFSKRKRKNSIARFLKHEHQKETKLIKMYIFMAGAYIVSYLPGPIFLMVLGTGVLQENLYTMISTLDVVIGLYTMASLLNPVITLLWKYDYTRQLVLTIRRQKERARRITQYRRTLSHDTSDGNSTGSFRQYQESVMH